MCWKCFFDVRTLGGSVKIHVICLAVILLGGCVQLSGDQWRWMDDPAQQQWVEIGCEGWGREIRFAIPDRLSGGSERVRSNLAIHEADGLVPMPACSKASVGHLLLAMFQWDYWWGGFLKDEGTDFAMDVSVIYFDDEPGFLDMSPKEWAEWRTEYWRKKYSATLIGNRDEISEKFFNEYRVEPFKAEGNSLTWVHEAFPVVSGHTFEYHLPVSDSHLLTFWFRVNGVRGGMEPDPAWAQRRLEMARKIMNSVTVYPAPW